MPYADVEDRRLNDRKRDRLKRLGRKDNPGPGSGAYLPELGHKKRGRKPGDGRGNLAMENGRDTDGWPTGRQFEDYEAALRAEWERT